MNIVRLAKDDGVLEERAQFRRQTTHISIYNGEATYVIIQSDIGGVLIAFSVAKGTIVSERMSEERETKIRTRCGSSLSVVLN